MTRPDRDPSLTRTGIKIRCPYHSGGQERTGSLQINLTKTDVPVGYWNCLACPEKGPWNKLAEKLGLKTLAAADKVHAASGFSFTAEEVEDMPDLKKLLPWPLESWRTINRETARLYDVRALFRRRELTAFIPVYEYGKVVGGIYAAAKKLTKEQKDRGMKSYIFTDGHWKNNVLFGFDIARKRLKAVNDGLRIVWIVEGARDAMKITMLGGVAVATLGSNFSPQQKQKLDVLDPDLILIGADPDPAGDKLTAMIEAHYSNTLKIEFPKDKDPAQLSEKRYEKIMRKVMRVAA